MGRALARATAAAGAMAGRGPPPLPPPLIMPRACVAPPHVPLAVLRRLHARGAVKRAKETSVPAAAGRAPGDVQVPRDSLDMPEELGEEHADSATMLGRLRDWLALRLTGSRAAALSPPQARVGRICLRG